MNRSELVYHTCKKIMGNNIKCLTIMMNLFDKDREDIIQLILDIMRKDVDAFTSNQIVDVYENKCDDNIDQFIKLIDRQFKTAKSIRSIYYNAYEKDVEVLQKEMTSGVKEDNKREFYTSKYHKYEG